MSEKIDEAYMCHHCGEISCVMLESEDGCIILYCQECGDVEMIRERAGRR